MYFSFEEFIVHVKDKHGGILPDNVINYNRKLKLEFSNVKRLNSF